MPTPPITPDYVAIVRGALARARRQGVEPAETLNKAHMLLTPWQERRLETEALRRFADELQRFQPHEMMRKVHPSGSPGSPADMFKAIQDHLEQFIEERRHRL